MNTNPDPDHPIKVIPGQVFTVSFESIPSAGYRWNVEYDPKIIDLKSNEFVPYSSIISKEVKAVGGGGWEIFEFQAREPGETFIKAKYQRSWEAKPLETKLFEVHIRQ